VHITETIKKQIHSLKTQQINLDLCLSTNT